jgi:hypothetical protein
VVAEQYLIKTVDGEDYRFSEGAFDESICPDGLDASVVAPTYYGDAGLIVGEIELSIAWEPPGLHITIERGEPTEAEIQLILNAMIKKLELKTGQKGAYIAL